MKNCATYLTSTLIVIAALLSLTIDAKETTQNQPDPKKQYDFLIGSWDCTFIQFRKDKETQKDITIEYPCNWNARYTFDGYMVQDDFRMYYNEQLAFAGTTLRTWVDKKQRWDLAFLAAGQGNWPNFHGVWQDSEMKIDASGEDQGGKYQSKIRFIDIEEDRFLWEMQKSYDEGKTWTLDSQIRSIRKKAGT